MTDIFANPIYSVSEFMVTSIGNQSSTLFYTNSTRKNILEIPDWENEIGYYGLRQTISYYVTQQRKYEIEIINKQSIREVPYRSFHDLFERSLCIDDKLVKVYVPIYFMNENIIGSDDEFKKKLNQEQNVNLSMEGQLDEHGYKLFIHDIQIKTELTYQSTIIPLTNLSRQCTIQSKRFGRSRLGRTIIETSDPTLEFTLTYKDYIRVLKCITFREYKKMRI